MLKKLISYEDFNGDYVTEEHYFHLSKADLIELEMSHKGGLAAHLQRIIDSEDGPAIMEEFRNLILKSYGRKSEDGKRFIKTKELRDEFSSTEAYSELFLELCTKADKAAEFVNGIVPPNLEADIAKLNITAEEDKVPSETGVRTRVLNLAEIVDMDSDELKSGLATGRYKLAP